MARAKKADQGGDQTSPEIEGTEGQEAADGAALLQETGPVDTRPINPDNGLPIGGLPRHDPHPPIPAKTEIIPQADFRISIRGVSLQFRDGKRAHVEPDVLEAIKAAGAPYKAVTS